MRKKFVLLVMICGPCIHSVIMWYKSVCATTCCKHYQQHSCLQVNCYDFCCCLSVDAKTPTALCRAGRTEDISFHSLSTLSLCSQSSIPPIFSFFLLLPYHTQRCKLQQSQSTLSFQTSFVRTRSGISNASELGILRGGCAVPLLRRLLGRCGRAYSDAWCSESKINIL